MTFKTLFRSHGSFIMNPQFFGRTLRVKGTLHEFVTDENGERRLLLENDGLTIQIDCSNAPDATGIQLGSVVSATGVCVLDSDIWRPSAPFSATRRRTPFSTSSASLWRTQSRTAGRRTSM